MIRLRNWGESKMISKDRLKEIIEEELTDLMIQRISSKLNGKLNEALTKDDYKDIKDLIRAELAAVFFDLFKKKQIWI